MPEPIRRLPQNPNQGTDRGREALRRSVEQSGWTEPGVVSSDNVALSGNHRLDLATEMGAEPLVIDHDGKRPLFVRLPVKSGTPEAFKIAANANRVAALNQNVDRASLAEQAEAYGVSVSEIHYTDEEIRVEEVRVDGPAGPPPTDGQTRDEISKALRDSGLGAAGTEEAEEADRPGDEERESPKERPAAPSRCKAGDLWEMVSPAGRRHRLLVGDCRDLLAVQRLVPDGVKMAASIFSPPYAERRVYDESSGFKPIPPDEYLAWFDSVQAVTRYFLAPDGSCLINIKSHVDEGERHLYVLDLVCAMKRKWGWRFIDELCWRRKGPPGRWPSRLRNDFEPVYHFSPGTPQVQHEQIAYEIKEENIHARGAEADSLAGHWNRPDEAKLAESRVAYPGNVLEAGGQSHGTRHKAVYPVKLVTQLLQAFTQPGDSVYDPFVGSGTLFLACEQTGRVGYGVELSALHADDILARWERLVDGGICVKASG